MARGIDTPRGQRPRRIRFAETRFALERCHRELCLHVFACLSIERHAFSAVFACLSIERHAFSVVFACLYTERHEFSSIKSPYPLLDFSFHLVSKPCFPFSGVVGNIYACKVKLAVFNLSS